MLCQVISNFLTTLKIAIVKKYKRKRKINMKHMPYPFHFMLTEAGMEHL